MTWGSHRWFFLFVFQNLAHNFIGITSSSETRQTAGHDQLNVNSSGSKPWRNISNDRYFPRAVGRSVGAVIEKKLKLSFNNAMVFLNSTLQGIKLYPKIVDNNPYSVLQAMCNNLTGKGLIGLVFICDRPCSDMTSFAGFLGWSGVVVKKHGNEHSNIFPKEPSSFLDISPHENVQNDAVIELFIQFQWKSICLIHDTNPSTLALVEDQQRACVDCGRDGFGKPRE